MPLIEQNNIHSCFLSSEFAKALETPFFYRAVDDLINYSLEIYEMNYKKGTPFVVGEEYTRGDAARLLGWSEGDASTIYGYMFKEGSPDWVIFVTYHKGSDVDPTIDYPDRFLDPSHFLWMSRKDQGITDKHALQLKNSSNKNIHLFVKRGQAGQEHCYVGTVKPESKLTRANTKDTKGKIHETFKVTFKLDIPVEKSTYDVLTKTPDLDFA